MLSLYFYLICLKSCLIFKKFKKTDDNLPEKMIPYKKYQS